MKLALLSVLAQALLQPQSAFAARRMRSAAEPFADERALVQDGARTWRFGHLTVTALSPFVRGANQYGKTIAFGSFLDESLARPDAPVVEFDEYKAKFRLHADPGWKLVGVPPIIELRMGERASFTVVCTERTDEKDEPVDLLLCGVDVRLGSTPEADEHPVHPRSSSPLLVGTTNLDPEEWIDPQTGECKHEGLLTPLSVKCAPVSFPFDEGMVTFQTSRATIYTEIEQPDGTLRLVPADDEYPEAEIQSRKFYLLGSVPSTSLRDGYTRITHSSHPSRDEISFTTFSPDFKVWSVEQDQGWTQTAAETKLLDESEAGFETNVLRDNWPISVEITCEQVSRGILPKAAITPTFETVVPTESIHPTTPGEIANHVGTTAVELRQVAGDAFKWWAPKVYWYGKAPTGSEPEYCCWQNRFGYQFVLVATAQSGAASVIRKRYKAGIKDPKAEVGDVEKSGSGTTLLDPTSVGGPWTINGVRYPFRCEVKLGRIRISQSIQMDTDCQYQAMILAEERYHMKQNAGEVDLYHGGLVDLFSPERIKANLPPGFHEDSGTHQLFYYEGTAIRAREEAQRKIENTENSVFEEDLGAFWRDSRRAYIEYAAKKAVGFKEAFRYHCSYEGKVLSKDENKVFEHNPMLRVQTPTGHPQFLGFAETLTQQIREGEAFDEQESRP